MAYTTRRLIRPAAVAAFLFVISTQRAGAQTTQPVAPAPAKSDFLTRYDFHLSAAALDTDDQRFKWETHFGGDLDVFDYVVGRASILVDYEAVLGNQYRAFDPNQGNYTLEASSSARLGETEIAGVFHHVSRHLSDRPKRFAVAWNIVGLRVLRRFTFAGTTIDAVAGGGRVVQDSYVDYTWSGELNLHVMRRVNERLSVFVHGIGEGFLVDETIAHRNRQLGGTIEAGLRIAGRAGALELFAGGERRFDADPIDRMTQQWALAGFRLVGK